MARSPQYWYDYMIAEKQTNSNLNNLVPNPDTNQTLLNDLTTPSKVADWRLWIWVVATCAYAVDVVFDLALLAFEELSKRSRFGTFHNFVSGDALPTGLTGNTTTKYFDAGITMAAFPQNSTCIGAYLRNDSVGSYENAGVYDGTSLTLLITRAAVGSKYGIAVNRNLANETTL